MSRFSSHYLDTRLDIFASRLVPYPRLVAFIEQPLERILSEIDDPGESRDQIDLSNPNRIESQLMQRALEPGAFVTWLRAYWPGVHDLTALPLAPVTCPDLADGHLSHLVGLNLSRAIYPYFLGQLLLFPLLLFERRLNLAMQTVVCRRPERA